MFRFTRASRMTNVRRAQTFTRQGRRIDAMKFSTHVHNRYLTRPNRFMMLSVAGLMALGLAACSSAEPAGDVAQGPADGDNVVRIEMTDSKSAKRSRSRSPPTTAWCTTSPSSRSTSTPDRSKRARRDRNLRGLRSGAEFVCTYHSDMTGRVEIKLAAIEGTEQQLVEEMRARMREWTWAPVGFGRQ